MRETAESASPRFDATPDPGLRVVDPVEGVDFRVETDRPVDPTPTDTDSVRFPLDAAVAVEAEEVAFPYLLDLVVRDDRGEFICDVSGEQTERFGDGRYTLELSKAPAKVYVAVDGPLTVRTAPNESAIRTDDTATFRVGVRSYHQRPAGTITTTADPADLATALSQFGSALKTRSPERSWPTLRGYPPLLETGETLHVPDAVATDDSGVTITVPPALEALFPVASLAFYLDATVRTGRDARLRAAGREWSLTRDGDVAATAANVLQRQVTLDCVVRTAGLYDYDIHGADALVEACPFDPAEVYDRPLPTRVAAYMDAPRDPVADVAPRWKLTADVVPDPSHVDALPHLVNDLAAVRCPDGATLADPAPTGRPEPAAARRFDDGATGSGVRSGDIARADSLVYPPETASVEHAYLGEGVPVGASDFSVAAYERQLDSGPTEETETSVTVVANDERMVEGDAVADVYGLGELASFDLTVRQGTTRTELRDALAAETDLLHYVGHVGARGFACADGVLDARALDSVGVRSFVLNACSSVAQGRALVDRGAVGGVVTVQDVFDSMADRVGETVARLLGQGYSLAGALDLCKRTTDFPTEEYVVVGDGSVRIAASENGIALGYRVAVDDGLRATPFAYPTADTPPGTTVRPLPTMNDRHFLAPGEGFPIETSAEAFADALERDSVPVLVDGDCHWSADLTASDLATLVGLDGAD